MNKINYVNIKKMTNEVKLIADKLNKNEISFTDDMKCLCLGYAGNYQEVVLVSPETGKVGVFLWDDSFDEC